ncbi:MAG: 5-oxoprolinase subunit B family protein [Pseudonocardiaceae bacterium]
MSPSPQVTCHDYGDAAVLVDIEGYSYDDRWDVAQRLGRALPEAGITGLVDVVSTFQNVVVTFDPLLTDTQGIRTAILHHARRPRASRSPRRFAVPAVYGGEHGPDLAEVAEELSLTPSGLVDLHTSSDWTVRFVGSPVGAPYMDGPSMPSDVARMRRPRAQVPAGSVALSGRQSVVYPAASPGGWRLIGRTPVRLFDLDREPRTAYVAGDLIRFFAIEADAWHDHETLVEVRP